MEVVELGPDDWRRWRAIRLAALLQDPQAFESTLAQSSGPDDTEERWRSRWVGVPHNLVASLDGVDVGVVGLAVPPGGEPLQVLSMWVAPEVRGHGVGDALVAAVLALAHGEHPGRDVALSVHADNELARRLYTRHEFAVTGPSRDGLDELRMVRTGGR